MPVELVVYSDFLCPWCWNAATRLASVEQQLGDDLAIAWRSFLLRPHAQPGRDLAKFRAYTQSWLRVAADEPRAPFQAWASDAGPPSHSVPAHVLAKAAARCGDDAGRRMRDRLFRAYFAESRDVTDPAVQRALWSEVGLPDDAFDAAIADPALARQVLAEHDEAVQLGVTGVPAFRLADSDFVLVGAQPETTILRWLQRVRDARAATA